MKTLKILFALCIMLGFSATAESQGKGKQFERPMKCSIYNKVIGVGTNYEILSINGNATHLGLVTGEMRLDKLPPAIPPLPFTPYLSGTITAANGDSFNFTSLPTMILNIPVDFTGIITGAVNIFGGTGRFAGCSGEIEITGIFDLANDYAKWTGEGWIKY